MAVAIHVEAHRLEFAVSFSRLIVDNSLVIGFGLLELGETSSTGTARRSGLTGAQ